MKIKLIFFWGLLFFQTSKGQGINSQLLGSWVSFKIEMKNNDYVLDNVSNKCLKFSFQNNTLYINNNPTLEKSNNPIPYIINGKLIKTSRISNDGFIIEKINKDTLIVSESFDLNSKRFYFINSKTLYEDYLKKNENNNSIIANQFFTPIQKKDITTFLNEYFNSRINANFKIKGVLKINLINKTIEPIIDSQDFGNEKKIKKVIDLLSKTFEYWDLTNYEKFESIEMPFEIIGLRVENFTSLRVNFINLE